MPSNQLAVLVEVQPLSDPEMGTLVRLFFTKVYEGSEAEVVEEVERFARALDAAEQAKSLGRTPLLLVMMLIIGRGRPLPDRRHKLYEFCIEQLLDARPGKRVQDGAQVASWQWAPEGFDARMRAVARLALWMHQNRDSSQQGRPVEQAQVAAGVTNVGDQIHGAHLLTSPNPSRMLVFLDSHLLNSPRKPDFRASRKGGCRFIMSAW
jgi:hypothetical protein